MNTLNRCLVMLLCLFFPLTHYADNTQVAQWTQNVLLNTLSINYTDLPTHFAKVKVNYVPTAWEALSSFLGDQVAVIQNDQLVLHPVAVGNAQVVNEGDYSGIHFWRVNQTIDIPELSGTISFSVIVIKATTPAYLIQSLNMTKTKY